MMAAKRLAICVVTLAAAASANGRDKARVTKRETASDQAGLLWRAPSDISTRNLFYGPGGSAHEPHGNFTFEKEDLKGTNPKFVVRDDQGVKWKVKLGPEARPEIVATRLVWAAGYFANEDYFLPAIEVSNMPVRLHRGNQFEKSDGTVQAVRLKRVPKTEKKVANWPWLDSPFAGTREFNGLRVLMALINNWDLTDENNGVYQFQESEAMRIYMVSDLGSSFGAPGLTWPIRKARGDLKEYRNSKFINKVTSGYVDFGAPRRDSFFFLATPHEFFQRLHLRWIGKRIPREDARWIGGELAQLSPDQVRDAFRAAGYEPADVDGFTQVVLDRIEALRRL
jgi:hypothetical protein